jgi:hypothetical protein
MPTQFLPGDVELAIEALLAQELTGVDTSSLGDAELDDDDQLVLQLPCARPRYRDSNYGNGSDLTQTTYPECEHIYEIWCADENLVSKAAERRASKAIAGRVLAVMAGAILTIPDGTEETSCPVRLLGVSSVPGDVIGMIYLVRIAVPGIAQFPGGAVNES